MSRPRKPTAMHLLTGAMNHDPQRFRDRVNEPKPELGIGEAPKWLDPSASAVWIELQAQIAAGVLTRQDRRMYGVLCSLLSQYHAAPADMTSAKLSTINSLAGQFGMTPSTRSKVAIAPAANPENPFAEFATNRFTSSGRCPVAPSAFAEFAMPTKRKS